MVSLEGRIVLGPAKIEVRDVLGRLLLPPITTANPSISLSTVSLEPGDYYVHVSNSTSVMTRKLVIVR